MSKSRTISVLLLWLTLLASLGVLAYLVRHYPVASMPAPQPAALPVPHLQPDGSVELAMPNGNLLASVGRYSTSLAAYLRLEYLQSLQSLNGTKILIRRPSNPNHPNYRIYVVLPNDYLSQSNRMLALQNKGQIPNFNLSSPPSSQISKWSRQTTIIERVYQRPPHEHLLQLPRTLLTLAVARFILFKSRTDPRVQLHLIPPDKVLTPQDAHQFAIDMIDVANFYHIPLSMLIGVGAMENNFIDVRGDLHHTVWVRHWQPGDILLRRRRGWLLIRDYSLGPWQITQSTLRYAHLLYLRDTRDYSQLPPRLRPPRKLDLTHVSTPVLTTYAGLLLSNLLTKFNGNQHQAAGAYNGGDRRPNMHYAQGVFLVADYARRVITHGVDQEQMRQLLQNSPPPATPEKPGTIHTFQLALLKSEPARHRSAQGRLVPAAFAPVPPQTARKSSRCAESPSNQTQPA